MVSPGLERLKELTNELQTKDLELKNTQWVLESFFELSIDLLCIADLNGHFKKLSPSWAQLGWTQEELCSKPFLDWVHPDDQERTKLAYDGLLNNQSITYFRNRYICKDGSYKILCWTAHPDLKKELVFCVARDFTAMMRKNSE